MAAEHRTEPWCDVLFVSSNATLDEVARAYRDLAKHFHPDVWTSASEKLRAMAAARMTSINLAFERAKQDISLREERRAAAASESARKAAAETAAAKRAEEERKAAEEAAARPFRLYLSPDFPDFLCRLILLPLVLHLDGKPTHPNRRQQDQDEERPQSPLIPVEFGRLFGGGGGGFHISGGYSSSATPFEVS